MATQYTKRRRTPSPEPADPYALDDDAPVYVPLKQRRNQLVAKLAAKGGGATAAAEKRKHEEEEDERRERERLEDDARRKKREQQTLLMEAQEVKRLKAIEGAHPLHTLGRGRSPRFRDFSYSRRIHPAEAAKSEQQKREEEEAKILLAQEAARKQLAGAEELAKGIVYTERMKTSCAAVASRSGATQY